MRDLIQPVRIRLSRAKGFDLQAASMAINGLPAVNCARPGPWGNPWTVAKARAAGFTGTDDELRAMCVRCFENALVKRLPDVEHIVARSMGLIGQNLACWCPPPKPGHPDPCHAAVLLDWLKTAISNEVVRELAEGATG